MRRMPAFSINRLRHQKEEHSSQYKSAASARSRLTWATLSFIKRQTWTTDMRRTLALMSAVFLAVTSASAQSTTTAQLWRAVDAAPTQAAALKAAGLVP